MPIPAHTVFEPAMLTVGVVPTVIPMVAVDTQPAEVVPVNVYAVLLVGVMVKAAVVAPVLQVYVLALCAVNVALLGAQTNVLPVTVTAGVMVTVVVLAEVHPFVVPETV